jgi:hypothetical protein
MRCIPELLFPSCNKVAYNSVPRSCVLQPFLSGPFKLAQFLRKSQSKRLTESGYLIPIRTEQAMFLEHCMAPGVSKVD